MTNNNNNNNDKWLLQQCKQNRSGKPFNKRICNFVVIIPHDNGNGIEKKIEVLKMYITTQNYIDTKDMRQIDYEPIH